MVSLQDSDAVTVDLFPPPLDVLLFPPLSVTFGILSCSKTQLAMQLPAEKKKKRVGTQVGCDISQWLT